MIRRATNTYTGQVTLFKTNDESLECIFCHKPINDRGFIALDPFDQRVACHSHCKERVDLYSEALRVDPKYLHIEEFETGDFIVRIVNPDFFERVDMIWGSNDGVD